VTGLIGGAAGNHARRTRGVKEGVFRMSHLKIRGVVIALVVLAALALAAGANWTDGLLDWGAF